MRLSVILGIAVLLPAVASAEVRFLGIPEISDRSVSWLWRAVPEDPIFTGNSTLKRIGSLTNGPLHTRGLAHVAMDAIGEAGFSFSRDGQEIFRWDVDTGVVTDTLAPVPGPVNVLAAAVHGNLVSAAAALDDGRVALWNLARTDTVWLFQAHDGPCHDVKYTPGVLGNRFFTAGADGMIHEWEVDLVSDFDPPQPEPRLIPIRFTEGEAVVLDISSDRRTLVAGNDLGEVRIWNLTSDVLTAILDDFIGSPTADVSIGAKREKLVTSHMDGGVTIWKLTTPRRILASFQPDAGKGLARASFTPPDDLLLLVSYEDGTLEARDGLTAQLFRSGSEESLIASFAPHPDGSRAILGRSDGDLILWRAGFCRPSIDDPVCFGGYKVWRGDRPERDAMKLLRTYSFGDSSWTFALTDTLRYFIDPDSVQDRGADPEQLPIPGPHNGFPWYYALTQFNRVFQSGSIFDVECTEGDSCVVRGIFTDPETGEPLAIIPRKDPRQVSPVLGDIWVVPNPYERGRVEWDELTFPHVRFVNLPAEAEIRIYTVAGELVRVVEHGKDSLGQDSGEEDWDLKNGNGEEVTSGVYVYAVKTPDGKTARGFFTVVM